MGKPARFTEKQKLSLRKQIKAGTRVATLAKRYGVTDMTIYRHAVWPKKRYKASVAKNNARQAAQAKRSRRTRRRRASTS